MASKVTVCLGPEEDDGDMAMDLFTGDLEAGCGEAEVPQGFEFRFESDFEEDREAEATQENGPSPEHTAVHRDDDLIMNRSIEEEEADIPREFEYYSEEDKPAPKETDSLARPQISRSKSMDCSGQACSSALVDPHLGAARSCCGKIRCFTSLWQ
jgi:hypothetical protein